MTRLILILSICNVFSASYAMQAVRDRADTSEEAAAGVLVETENNIPENTLEAPLKKPKIEATVANLFFAINLQKTVWVSDLIEAGAPLAVSHALGYTPLHEAASSGSLAVVKLLLEAAKKKGIDIVNVKRFSGETPLHDAALRGHGAIVRLLLKYDADASINDRQNETALDKARHSYNLFDGVQFKQVVDILAAAQ